MIAISVRNNKYIRELIPIVVLLLIIVVFFHRFISGREIFWSRGDIITYFFPTRFFYGQSIKQLILPLWSSGIGSGFPLFAGIQVGMLYPINLIAHFLLPFPIAFNTTILVHIFMAGLFMFLYIRSLNLGRFTAFFAATAFMLSGYVTVRLPHLDLFFSSVWLPFLFFCIEKRYRENDRRYLVLLSIACGVNVLAGSLQGSILCLFASALYFIFRFVQHYQKKITKRTIAGFSLEFVSTYALGIGLAAVQLLPTYELYGLSLRKAAADQLGLGFSDSYAGTIMTLLTLFFPFFFGSDRAGEIHGGTYWGENSFQEMTYYIGILPLILAFAIFLHRSKERKNYILFFAFLLLITFILGLGSDAGLYAVWQMLPFLSSVRAPVRFFFISSFSLTVLAGFGIEALVQIPDIQERGKAVIATLRRFFLMYFLPTMVLLTLYLLSNRTIFQQKLDGSDTSTPMVNLIGQNMTHHVIALVILGISISMFFMWGKGKIQNTVFKVLCMLVLLADLFIFGTGHFFASGGYMRGESFQEIIKEQPLIAYLQKNIGLHRLITYPAYRHFFDSTRFTLADLVGDSPLSAHLQTASIYSNLDTARYEALLSNLNEGEVLNKGEGKNTSMTTFLYGGDTSRKDAYFHLYNLLGVRYVVTDSELNAPNLQRVIDDGYLKVYENTSVLPRLFTVSAYTVVHDQTDLFTTLIDPAFDPRVELLLEEEPKSSDRLAIQNAGGINDASAEITYYSDEEVRANVVTTVPTYALLTDNYYPGWKAYVDGREQTIYRADWTFRAVFVPEGTHDLRFVFQPQSFTRGLYASIGSGVLLLGAYILFSRSRQKA